MEYKPKKVLKNHPAAMYKQQVVENGVIKDWGKRETLYLLESDPTGNWDYYINEIGDNVYYIAKPNSGAESGWYGSLEYYLYERKNWGYARSDYKERMQALKKRLKELGFVNSNTIDSLTA